MPLYPYRCTQCGHQFEKIQSFSAEPDKVCPKCGGAVEREITAPGLQFKGAGWYVNDYAPKSSGGNSSPTSDSSAAETKAPAKSDGAAAASSTPAAPAATPASSSSSTS